MGVKEGRLESNRIVLREEATCEDVERFASQLGWPRRADFSGDPETMESREVMWTPDSITIMHYIEDAVSPERWVSFSGHDGERLAELQGSAARMLPSWSRGEIIEYFDHVGTSDLVRATLLVGIGSPNSFDRAFFSRVSRGLRNPDTRIRQAAIWATTYSQWSEYRTFLESVARHDRDADRRRDAKLVLAGFDVGDDES